MPETDSYLSLILAQESVVPLHKTQRTFTINILLYIKCSVKAHFRYLDDLDRPVISFKNVHVNTVMDVYTASQTVLHAQKETVIFSVVDTGNYDLIAPENVM